MSRAKMYYILTVVEKRRTTRYCLSTICTFLKKNVPAHQKYFFDIDFHLLFNVFRDEEVLS